MGDNLISGIFGHFGFDPEDQQKTQENYQKAFKKHISPPEMVVTRRS